MNNNLNKWLCLCQCQSLGPGSIKKLWDKFGSIDAIFAATERDLLEIERLPEKALTSLLKSRSNSPLNFSLPPGIKALTLDDQEYPRLLKEIYDPPPVLYFRGNLPDGVEKSIAIVGTRKASHYGLSLAEKLAFELAQAGLTIVSGLALGIDTSAHEGALNANGQTIAVLGCGVDCVYPPENKELMECIVEKSTVVSEFSPGTEVEAWRFPRRNRIISGLSLGVIVVEGHYDSGAMITAKQALDQGREVFAVPGKVEGDLSKGPHWLIKQGAKLVESVEDVLEELHLLLPTKMSNVKCQMTNECRNYSNLSEMEQKLVQFLSLTPKHIDKLVFDTGFSVAQISSLLLPLEIKKIIKQLPGKMFVLLPKASC